jgi:hypothetical protein
MTIDYFSAFIIGILGSGHCIGMCGGITTMLTTAIPESSKAKKLPLTLSYHFGRISSYALIGAIAGFTGSLAAKSIGMPIVMLRLMAGVFLIFLGLYLAQWLMWLTKIEKIGKLVWRYISPLSKRFIPVTSNSQAVMLGVLWGWLPCGLIYSTLTWSLASGHPVDGALLMLCFGLGTLPSLISVSFGYLSIKKWVTNKLARQFIGSSLIAYGFYNITQILKTLI